jgi:hypothetical protein
MGLDDRRRPRRELRRSGQCIATRTALPYPDATTLLGIFRNFLTRERCWNWTPDHRDVVYIASTE